MNPVSTLITVIAFTFAVTASAAEETKKRKRIHKDRHQPNYERYMADEEYQDGRRTRLSGILLTSIGGGVGGGLLVTGILWNSCWGATESQRPKCQRNARVVTAVGAVTTAGSIGFGVPMIALGREKMTRARGRIDGEFPVKPTDGESDGEVEAGNNPFGGYSLAVRVLNVEF